MKIFQDCVETPNNRLHGK